ncbi:MAG: efflux RND transporter periplasmic adaptor subunit [Fuerstiella sp.]|nr:efflux RND transporter periplasmic adaptor subunit [Fuerstiella sp.]
MKSKLPCLVVFISIIVPLIAGADGRAKAADAEKKNAETVTVSGVFEAVAVSEIRHDTDHLKSFVISKIVPHGTMIRKGQNVVWFESEDLDRQLRKAEVDLRLSRLTLDDDEFAFEQFQEIQRLDREAAERSKKKAQQDHDNFVREDRDRQVKAAEFNLKSSTASLANATEELRQLEQMYKEDDLTEESEEIVLKRARQSVESAEYRLEGTRILSLRTLSQTIPQSDVQHAATLTRSGLTYRKAIRDLSSSRVRREIEMARKRKQFEDEEIHVREMQHERKQIALKAPHDGIVFHGPLQRGKLGDKESSLEPGSKVTNEQTIATISEVGRLHVRVELSEDKLRTVTVGAKCAVKPKAFPDVVFTATVKSVSRVPFAGTKYDCVVTFRHRNDVAIVPTMTCDVEFAAAVNSENGDRQERDTENE